MSNELTLEEQEAKRCLRNDLDTLRNLRRVLFDTLGPCIDKFQTQPTSIKLVDAPSDERPGIIQTNWYPGHLERVEPLLQQIAILESRITQS